MHIIIVLFFGNKGISLSYIQELYFFLLAKSVFIRIDQNHWIILVCRLIPNITHWDIERLVTRLK